MNWMSGNVVGVLVFLLPGFVAAAVFYSLTSHPKPGAFDRVIQALIFTVVGQSLVVLVEPVTGEKVSQWESEYALLLSVSLSVAVALILAFVTNSDTVHRVLRKLGVTRETSYPSEWYSAFARLGGRSYVVLHLKGQRRLYGWPEEWPSHPKEGHFRIAEGQWLDDERQPSATLISAILIPAGDVEMVEFLGGQSGRIEEETDGQGTDAAADAERETG